MPTTPKLYFVNNTSEGDTKAQVETMLPYTTTLNKADFIYCASISVMKDAEIAVASTGKPLVVYCWDYYLWAHGKVNHSGDWNKYAEFLKSAKLIFVPSHAQQLRLKELLGLDSVVVRSGVTVYDHEVTDAGFILDPMRYYPDETAKWAVKAAEELGIPIVHSEHQFSKEEFRKLVASCSFMTSTVSEASTGALTLVEGLYLDKVSLVSDSPYMGAKDYLGGTAYYFKHDSFEDLKDKMGWIWERRPLGALPCIGPNNHILNEKEYVEKALSYELMSKQIYKTICELH